MLAHFTLNVYFHFENYFELIHVTFYFVLSGAECNNRLLHLELFHKNCITTNMFFVWNIFCEKVPNEATGCYIRHQRVILIPLRFAMFAFSKLQIKLKYLFYCEGSWMVWWCISLEKDASVACNGLIWLIGDNPLLSSLFYSNGNQIII